MLYSKTVTDHYTNPRNVGDIEDPSGLGESRSEICGDRIRVTIRIGEGKICEAKFKSYGCGASIAAASVTTEWMIGRSVEEAMKLDARAILGLLGGLPPEKIHCAVMAEEAVKAALLDHLRKSGAGCGGDCAGCGGDCAGCADAGREEDGHGEA